MKKGQGISLNVIIIAAIALIVLVVLIAIFTGRLNVFNRELGQVSDAEVFRVQAMSDSRCVPSKEGISGINDEVKDLSELQAKSTYNQRIQDLVNICASNVLSIRSETDNRDVCNAVSGCTWK